MNKLAMIALVFANAAQASSLADPVLSPDLPPRGPEIGRGAANCGIGPFPRLGKAGRYNELCTTLTDAEKCLALIKRQMSEVGEVTPVGTSEIKRAEFCLDTFRKELLKAAE